MPAARWARRWRPITCMPASPARCRPRPMACGLLSRAGLFAQDDIETALTAAGARFRCDRDGCGPRQARGRKPWPKARRWAGSRAAWSSARARSGTARSWAIRGRRPCRRLLNLKVKYRESFRPFAPSVLREDVGDWFELDGDSPYMLLVADVVKRRRRAMTADEQEAVRHRQAECAALRHPGGDACGLLGPRPDRAHGNQPALPCADLAPSAA